MKVLIIPAAAVIKRDLVCPGEMQVVEYREAAQMICAASVREAALREELRNMTSLATGRGDRVDSLRERLTVAEQRISELESLLSEVVGLDPRGEFLGWQLDGKIDAALKPVAEGEGL